MFELTTWDSLVYTLLILFLMLLLSKLLATPPTVLNIRDNRNGHRWTLNKFIIDFPLHCNGCETFLFTATGTFPQYYIVCTY